MTTPHEALRAVLRGDERIAVTGATGWLGSTALELLDETLGPDEAESAVSAYASRPRTVRTTSGREIAVRALSDLPYEHPSPTHILHFAFLTRNRLTDLSVADYAEANLTITAVVLDAVARHRPRGLVVASSGAVYGPDHRLATDLVGNPYGMLKHLDELAFRSAAKDVGATAVIPRVFSVAGAHITKPELYALGNLILLARSTGRLQVRSPGAVVRSFAGVADVVALSLWLALAGRDTVFDTGGEVAEIGGLAAAVADVLGLSRDAIERHVDREAPEDRYVGDAAAWDGLLAEAGITPTPLLSLVRDTAVWLGREAEPPVESDFPTLQKPQGGLS